MHLVDDEHLVARIGRLITHGLHDLADVVDAGMRGGVHLHHVHMAALDDRLAVLAEIRHVDGRAEIRAGLGIVQRAGDDAGRRGFAHPADAGEHIGLRDAAALERVFQRAHHRLLADQVAEGGRPVFAREHDIGLAVGGRRGGGVVVGGRARLLAHGVQG
jgi:hypothetical protein